RAHNVARANDVMGLPALLRNFAAARREVICRAALLTPLARAVDRPARSRRARCEGRGPARSGPFLHAWTGLKRTRRTLHFAKRNEAFRRHAVNHWNPYGGETKHFAGLFVFKGLTPFSFRRVFESFVFNGLAPLFVSPVCSFAKGLDFLKTEMISGDSGFVKSLFAAAAIARRKDRASPMGCRNQP